MVNSLTEATIRVVIVDDHPCFRAGVHKVLEQEPDVVVVAEITRGDGAFEAIKERRPQVVVMAVNLPASNGLQITKRVRDHLPDTQVVNLTAYHDEAQILHALRAGAAACLPKEVMPSQLLFAIREAKRGRVVIEGDSMSRAEAGSWARQALKRMGVPHKEISIRLRPITERQMEILQGIASGMTNEEIADQRGVSRHTIKNQVYTIFRKLGVRDRTQAALYALRYGWARLPEVLESQR